MDYPKSVPNVGLVDGKFIDENTVTGAVGSLIPSAWGNAVTDEILTVIKAAGIVPSEGETDQLLKAIRGSSMFATQPQFTATKDVATTEFVQRALGNFSGQTNINTATAVITSAMAGRRIVASVPGTLTLSQWSLNAAGSKFYIQNVSGGEIVVSRWGTDSIVALSRTLNSITIPSGSNAVFVCGETSWVLEEGVAALKYSTEFATTLDAVGKERMPSGKIRQWGFLTTSSSGDLSVLFNEVFPTKLISLMAIAYIGGGATRDTNVMVRTDGFGRTGFSVGAFLTGTRVAEAVYWVAEGY